MTEPIQGETLKERISSSTRNRGLKEKVPDNFNSKGGDWRVIKSENPFEALYLDHEQYKNISPEMIKQNYETLLKFWENKIDSMKGATEAQIVAKYGGEHGTKKTIQDYLILLKKAYDKLSSGVENCFLEMDAKRQNAGRQQLLSTIVGILADGIYEPNEKNIVYEVGRKACLTDEEIEEYFEKNLLEQGFSPDPDADFAATDTLPKKLSVIWRTVDKHNEVSIHKFELFLDGKLHNGIYNPDDYATITEATTGILRRDAIKQKEILVNYLKGKGFKPAGQYRPGNELSVVWKTDWYKEEPGKAGGESDEKKEKKKKRLLLKTFVTTCVLLTALVIAKNRNVEFPGSGPLYQSFDDILNAINGGKEQPPNPQGNQSPAPAPAPAPAAGSTTGNGDVQPPPPIIEPQIMDLKASVLDTNDRPISSFVAGQTIKLASQYEILTSPDVKTIEVEENNYLVAPNGSRTPDAIRTKQVDSATGILSSLSVTIPDGFPPGIYEHVATVKVGDKVSKATQPITVASVQKMPESDQVVKQQEIRDYLAKGKQFFEMGKYELCIEKMKEVLRRDRNNYEAGRYIQMAKKKLDQIEIEFENPTVGRAR